MRENLNMTWEKKTANTPHQIYPFLQLKHPISPIAEYRGLPPNLNLWPPSHKYVCVCIICVYELDHFERYEIVIIACDAPEW